MPAAVKKINSIPAKTTTKWLLVLKQKGKGASLQGKDFQSSRLKTIYTVKTYDKFCKVGLVVYMHVQYFSQRDKHSKYQFPWNKAIFIERKTF